MWQAEVRVDLDAIRENVDRLRAGTSAELMAVVKGDGYGHGMVPAAVPRLTRERTGSASAPWTRRWRCAPPVSTPRCWPGCSPLGYPCTPA